MNTFFIIKLCLHQFLGRAEQGIKNSIIYNKTDTCIVLMSAKYRHSHWNLRNFLKIWLNAFIAAYYNKLPTAECYFLIKCQLLAPVTARTKFYTQYKHPTHKTCPFYSWLISNHSKIREKKENSSDSKMSFSKHSKGRTKVTLLRNSLAYVRKH